jgi:hypothetical protein
MSIVDWSVIAGFSASAGSALVASCLQISDDRTPNSQQSPSPSLHRKSRDGINKMNRMIDAELSSSTHPVILSNISHQFLLTSVSAEQY